jgi:hypothetical protein
MRLYGDIPEFVAGAPAFWARGRQNPFDYNRYLIFPIMVPVDV